MAPLAAPSARATPGTLRAWRDWRLALAVVFRAFEAAFWPVARAVSAAPGFVPSKEGSPLTAARPAAAGGLGSPRWVGPSHFSSSGRDRAARPAGRRVPPD